MSCPNLGWLYWIDYFRGVDYAHLKSDTNATLIKEKTDTLLRQSVWTLQRQEYPMPGNAHFQATTRYPGLLIGTGYRHELPDIQNQPILGFHFDYTTGLPVIPGSSIKGILRSAFEHPAFVAALLNESVENENETWSEDEIEKLAVAMFGSPAKSDDTVRGSDIFFDAVIVNAVGNILDDDYITPHGDGVTDEPTPLRFVKVSSGVTFRFDFELNDTKIGDKTLTKEKKRELFIKILKHLGLGAKTNVGYGHLEHFVIVKTDEEKAEEKEQAVRQAFDEVKNDIRRLERFISEYAGHPLVEKATQRLTELKQQEAAEHIKGAYQNLDKTNPKHIESFIAKYEADPNAKEYVEKARTLIAADNEKPADIDFLSQVSTLDKLKSIENLVKNIIATRPLDEDEKNALENAISKAKDLPKKRKKFPFSTFGNDKALGKERANRLADELGL